MMTRIFLLLLTFTFSCAPNTSPEQTSDEVKTVEKAATTYDARLAEELGADDYGMKQYVLAFLKAGPNRSQDSLEAAQLQRAHMDNIGRLAKEGKLILAGPFMDGGALRGIYIFDVRTLEEAQALTATDPAIQAGRLEMELHPWYGSAALLKINEWHERLAKEKI
jgi:uncharacterized protein YciI